jgi:hypothetical protein
VGAEALEDVPVSGAVKPRSPGSPRGAVGLGVGIEEVAAL